MATSRIAAMAGRARAANEVLRALCRSCDDALAVRYDFATS
jgi:hypothetical protein